MTHLDFMPDAVADDADYRTTAGQHLWRHFAEMAEAERTPLKVITRGEGSYLFDTDGNRYLDAVSNLFCVNLGYSYGEELGQAALDQYRQLGYHSNWTTTHPRAIELAARLAELAPDDLNHVFLTPSGGESVEAAWKIARQFYQLRGENRWKAIARDMAYHGTTLGALSLGGIHRMRSPFEPLVPAVAHARSTARAGRPAGESEEDFTAFLLDDLEQRIVSEDPSTVAMIILEPIQNHGGSLTPPNGYFAGIRALADKYGILLVSDETITAFGRVGEWFGSTRFDFTPDIITTAKGLSSAHAVIGAVIVNNRVYEPFSEKGVSLQHGNTFGGHPVMAAVALKNLEIMERLQIPEQVRAKENSLRTSLESLRDLEIVSDVRGAGFFWSVELTGTDTNGSPLSQPQRDRLFARPHLAGALEDLGILTRVSLDSVNPIICVSPPLVAEDQEFTLIRNALAKVLSEIDSTRKSL
ncbi:aminotransferase class III-fold pyridoxal phosphate-dependent enzyme [Rhodococcus sp. NPDC019627]|uniref:Aminotransferase n=1 Tax=Rhodococcus opacus (strain B4) TaxID=632772 RepID=C1BDU4_RHOOB|nr:aminotransferase [Rhodococcus opacus B4]